MWSWSKRYFCLLFVHYRGILLRKKKKKSASVWVLLLFEVIFNIKVLIFVLTVTSIIPKMNLTKSKYFSWCSCETVLTWLTNGKLVYGESDWRLWKSEVFCTIDKPVYFFLLDVHLQEEIATVLFPSWGFEWRPEQRSQGHKRLLRLQHPIRAPSCAVPALAEQWWREGQGTCKSTIFMSWLRKKGCTDLHNQISFCVGWIKAKSCKQNIFAD